MIIDTCCYIGAYPWRRVPGTDPASLLAAMDRTGIERAWITHLPGFWWRDPTEGNDWLYHLADTEPRFRPVPFVHPGLGDWTAALDLAVERRAVAVRCDPTWLGVEVKSEPWADLAAAAAVRGLPMLLAVRLEDGRQRHPLDVAEDLTPSVVRYLIRRTPDLNLLVAHADRGFIEEVHFGSTPAEASRIWWDISWIWGPPEDHLATLLGTLGPERFVFGTGMPLRIPEASMARLDLLELDPTVRSAIESGNALALEGR